MSSNVNRLSNFWKDVLKLPYKSNSQTHPYHEQQIQELLTKHNFDYIVQPNGTQKSPDIRVILDDGNVLDIECKSTKGTCPMYNSGLPKQNVFYILCSERYNETTIYLGDDVVRRVHRDLYNNLNDELHKVLEIFRKNPEWNDNERGFDYYIRPMYTQKGNANKKDYFKHYNRVRCEQNVINWHIQS